jgi:hypothetical protein
VNHCDHQVKPHAIDAVVLEALRELRNSKRQLVGAIDAHAQSVIDAIPRRALEVSVNGALLLDDVQMGSKLSLEVRSGGAVVRGTVLPPQVIAGVALCKAQVLSQY